MVSCCYGSTSVSNTYQAIGMKSKSNRIDTLLGGKRYFSCLERNEEEVSTGEKLSTITPIERNTRLRYSVRLEIYFFLIKLLLTMSLQQEILLLTISLQENYLSLPSTSYMDYIENCLYWNAQIQGTLLYVDWTHLSFILESLCSITETRDKDFLATMMGWLLPGN